MVNETLYPDIKLLLRNATENSSVKRRLCCPDLVVLPPSDAGDPRQSQWITSTLTCY